jgi:hypothetical protein
MICLAGLPARQHRYDHFQNLSLPILSILSMVRIRPAVFAMPRMVTSRSGSYGIDVDDKFPSPSD